ncbi:MAG TPA: glycosyltransferase family 39 protein, partial [Chitinophagaceae bacterium]|nr:glycosyltransferase family 39 protein [Chitinophagaceae bacterium]
MFLTVLVFAQTLDHSFFTIDDATYVSSNALVQHPSMKILTTPVCQNYHPLTMISLALDATAGENNPAIYHRTNLILHVLNSVLVLFLAYRLLKNSRSAFFVSLLFAIHPLHVESVAWIAERKDLLYTLFYLLAMLTYIQYLEKKKVLWILITGLLFAASLLSKSQAVPFPFILLLLDYWYHRSDWGILALEKIPFFILSLFFGFIALQTQSDAVRDFLAEPVLMKRIVMAFTAIGLYFVKLLVPYSLSVFYPYPSGMQMQPEFLLALLLLLAALFLLFKYRRDRIIVFGSLFFLISLVPVLQFKSFGAAFMAERYTYLSSVGLFLIMLHVLLRYRPLSGIYGTVLPILLVAVYAWLCWQRTSLWRDERNLLLDADKKYPSVYVKNVLGNWYGQQGQLDSGRYMIAQAM